MEKASESTAKVSPKIVKELKIAKSRITFCHFPYDIQLKNLYTLIFLDDFNEVEDNFVFACNFPW